MKNKCLVFTFSAALMIAGCVFFFALGITGDKGPDRRVFSSSEEKIGLSSTDSSVPASVSAGTGTATSLNHGTRVPISSSPARTVRSVDKKTAKSGRKAADSVGKQTDADFNLLDGGLRKNFVLALDEIWVTDADGKGRVVSVGAASPEELDQLVVA